MSDTSSSWVSTEVGALKAWLKAPFTTAIPLWQLMATFVVFVVLGFIVIDNLDLLKKGLQVKTP